VIAYVASWPASGSVPAFVSVSGDTPGRAPANLSVSDAKVCWRPSDELSAITGVSDPTEHFDDDPHGLTHVAPAWCVKPAPFEIRRNDGVESSVDRFVNEANRLVRTPPEMLLLALQTDAGLLFFVAIFADGTIEASEGNRYSFDVVPITVAGGE
jgi:hypothetical protein